VAFSDKGIQNLKPGAKPRREFDKGSDPGFGVQVTPAGTKTFFLAYRFDGRRRFMNLGTYPDTSLADARATCRDSRALLDKGVDPQEHRNTAERERREAAEQAQREETRGTVAQLFAAYIANLAAQGKPSAEQISRIYGADVGPVIGAMKAAEVTPRDIKRTLFRIIERGAMVQANRVRSYLLAAFKFGIEHDNHPANMKAEILFDLQTNPVRDVPKALKREAVGDRELGADEIRDLWTRLAQGTMDPLSVGALRLMLATGQRLGEVLGAPWVEFDLEGRKWEIPAKRTKNNRAHVVPLADLHLEILAQLRPYSGASEWVFPKRNGTGPRHIDSISQAVARFCNPGATSKRPGFPKFTPRDLRRTWKTRAGEIGLGKEIRDRLQNHALTDVSSQHYDRYDYMPEKRKAMEAWCEWLGRTIGNVPGIGERSW
jgi:integrase